MAFRFSEAGLAQIGELAAGYAIGGAVSTALEPALQSLRNRLWIVDPSLPVDVATLAALVRAERLDHGDAVAEAAHSGTGPANFDRYLAATEAVPGPADLFALVRRGELAVADLETWIMRGGADLRLAGALATLVREHLSPAEAAMARQQSFIDGARQHQIAAVAGIEAEDAEIQFEIAGEPPGPEQMIELWRRGKVSEDRVRQAIVEGRIKLKYTDDVLALRDVPLSVALAVEAVVRERKLPRDPHYYAEAAGVSAEDFDAWVELSGRPIAPGEALQVVNRGLKGPPDGPEARAYFREVIARSDVRTEYADDLHALRIHYPPLFQVSRALQNGTVTAAVARDTLAKEGYPTEWVDAIVNAHAGGKAAKSRDLSASIVDALYEAGIYTHPEAEKALEALGYDATEANDYLDLWLARRIVADLVKALGLIERRYVGWKIDRTEAEALLAALPIPGEVGQRLLPLWTDEREANAPTLTASEVERGFKYQRFTFDEAMQALQRMGFSLDDALTKLWVEMHGDPRPAG